MAGVGRGSWGQLGLGAVPRGSGPVAGGVGGACGVGGHKQMTTHDGHAKMKKRKKGAGIRKQGRER